MSSLPTFDSVNNTKIFNGTSQYMQIAPTNINLANGFAITTTFTPTAATPPTSGETLCSFFQGTGASNAITIARSNVTSQFNLNFINSIGSNQGINIGNLVSGNTYQLAIQSYLNNTNFNINATSLTANQSLTTYYTGSSLITSITAYATSLIANYTSSGYLTTTPLSIYLYNGSTWTLVAYTTCFASSSVTLISSISPNQTSVYKLALSVIGDGATYLSYNTNQSTNTLFNTPAIPTFGTITPAAQQFTIGAATYSAGYLSTTVATYTLAVSPFTTFTNSIASTLGAASTTIASGSLTANTQYQIKLVIADPVNTSVLSSLIYTLATVSFVATPITNLTSTSFTVTWNSAGSPATYYSVNLTVALTSTPFTTVYTQNGITAVSGTTSMSINPPLVANTGYTVSLVPLNNTAATNTAVTTTTTTYAIVTSASAAVTSYASATITYVATSGANVYINSTPTTTTQLFSSSPALFVSLSPNTSYTFTVTAVNASGTNPSAGDKKTTGSITTYTQGTLGQPTAASTTYNSVSVNWSYGGGYSSGTAATIYISTTTNSVNSVASTGISLGQTQPVGISGLSSSTSYYIIVSVPAGTYGPLTNGVSASTFATLALGTLGQPTTSSPTNNGVSVSWSYGGYPSGTSATIYISTTTSTANQVTSQAITLGQGQPYTFTTGLTQSSPYYAILYVPAGSYGPATTSSASAQFNTTGPVTLYTFSSFTFTPAGAGGASGPSLSQMQTYGNSASGGGTWTQNTSYLNAGTGTKAGMYLWTVPRTTTYTFAVAAASGYADNPYTSGGRGLIVNATLSLTVNTVIVILVGQAGVNSSGGGGGSFIYNNSTSTLLLVAGGGGGTGSWGNGGDGQTGTSGSNGTGGPDGNYGTAGVGGSGGNGGAATTGGTYGGARTPGGGAGYTGNGAGAVQNSAYSALSFTNGGTGGGTNQGGSGGFGGGGGAGGPSVGSGPIGGGGGGYSGGGAGTCDTGGSYDFPRGGGGGGSYTIGTATGITYAYNPATASPYASNGYVTITAN